MKRLFWLIPLVLCLCAVAQQFNGGIEGYIEDYGIYAVAKRQPETNVRSQDGKPGQPIHISKTLEFASRTNRVVAAQGVSFGFRFVVTGLPTNTMVKLHAARTNPKIVLPDGSIDTGKVLELQVKTPDGKLTNHFGYSFDDKSEMVAGAWTFTILSDGLPLASKIFMVEVP